MPASEESKRVGPWTCVELLGQGGNARVWRASRNGEQFVALKVLRSKKALGEPYRRFRQEVKVLRDLRDVDGVLPLIDAHLPDAPSAKDPAWLAMPLATILPKALEDAGLETVVVAVATIASTLAVLAKRGIGHRDVKPNNLYDLAGTWRVGDFGLVAAPNLEELTRTGRPLGPTYFMPYEMINSPESAQPGPADVFSLAKTLWVLATRSTFPPLGHQPADERGQLIADLRPHIHAEALDRLIDRSTLARPEHRPTMSEFAADLAAWHELGKEARPIDVSQLRSRLQTKMQRELDAQDVQTKRKELAYGTIRKLQELGRPLDEALKQLHPTAQLDQPADKLGVGMLKTHRSMGMPSIVLSHARMSRIASEAGNLPYALRWGRALELTGDGELIFRAFVFVAHEGVSGNAYVWQLHPKTAAVGSIQAERMLEEGFLELRDKLQEGITVFVESLPVS